VIVNGDMDELPTGATTALRPVGGDAMTGLLKATQLLDVEMQQVTRSGMLVTLHGWGGFEVTEPLKTGTA
jgi:hypothetical protein